MLRALTILGLDPGLKNLGWGVVRSEANRLTYIASGTVATKASDVLAERLKSLHEQLTEIIAAQGPGAAAVEETFVNADMRAALKLAQARAIALLVPAQAGLPVSEYAPNLIKKSVVGSGHASKEQIRVMVCHLLPGCSPASEHEADALAVAIAHAHLSQTVARLSEAMR
ncbi:MAG: crossover junction endodeoxyribonuclease RuvC [Alphaproteobacteria bacterium]